VWYSTFVVMRDSSNPLFSLMNSDAVNEPRRTGRSFSRLLDFPADPLPSHTIPLTSNDSRRVNNLRNAKNLTSSNEHTDSFNSKTVSARDPKHALSDASSKLVKEMAVRARDLRLVNAERWDLARRSSFAQRVFSNLGEYFGTSWREVTLEESREDA